MGIIVISTYRGCYSKRWKFGCDMTMLVISANMCFCVQYRKCALFGNASQPLRGNCISPFHPTLFQRGQKSHFENQPFNFQLPIFSFQLSTLNFHPTLFQRGQQKSHFERAGLFSTVHFQIYLHCFNGGSKSHISREASKSHHWNSAVSSIRELAVVVQTELVWRLCCYIWREIYFTNPCAVALSSHVYPFKRGALKYLLFWIAPSLYI